MSIRNSSILIFKRLIYVPVLYTSFLGGLPAASGAVKEAIKGNWESSNNTNWYLWNDKNGNVLAVGWNKATVTYTSRTAFIADLPSGYTLQKVITGCGFADGNVNNVSGAVHGLGNSVVVYLDAGNYLANNIRVVCIASKA